MLEQQMQDEVSLKRRIADFKKALSKNGVLEEFDRGIFESIIEKVIVGGYDEDGNKIKETGIGCWTEYIYE